MDRKNTQPYTNHEPGRWQVIAYKSLIPALILIPIWVAGGRGFFSVGGWGVLITIIYAVVLVFPYQLILLILSLVNKQKYLTKLASGLLYTYYGLLVLTQISLVDGGDTTESINSVLTKTGISEPLSEIIFSISFDALIGVMMILIIVMIVDTVQSRRAHNL